VDISIIEVERKGTTIPMKNSQTVSGISLPNISVFCFENFLQLKSIAHLRMSR
jgi:hypothetical protein